MGAAIVAGVGAIVGAVGNMVSSANANKTAYQTWLAQSVPTYTDIFGNYKSEENNQKIIIIGILTGLIVVLIIAILIKNRSSN